MTWVGDLWEIKRKLQEHAAMLILCQCVMCRDDIRICRSAEGKKCRLGEGGFGVVYKALMNGVDEVAVKLVKADKPSAKEMALFHKEVLPVPIAG